MHFDAVGFENATKRRCRGMVVLGWALQQNGNVIYSVIYPEANGMRRKRERRCRSAAGRNELNFHDIPSRRPSPMTTEF
jgi:hypothetical protein